MMETPDRHIVPLHEEDASFPDEVKEIYQPEEIEILDKLRQIQQKREKFRRRKEIKNV